MARFIFRLEAVLQQRRSAERAEMIRVAAIERDRASAERALAELDEQIAESGRDLSRLAADGLRPGVTAGGNALLDLRLQAGYTAGLRRRAEAQAVALAGILARLGAARVVLVKAAAARRAVELLRERRYDEWRRDQARRDAAALDEQEVMRRSRGAADPIAEDPDAADSCPADHDATDALPNPAEIDA